jgi:3-isopropylmalate dehydrogenase
MPHDFIVIRENTEGPYVGEGGVLRKGTVHEVATQGSVNTRHGVERCIRYAFDLQCHVNVSMSLWFTRQTY